MYDYQALPYEAGRAVAFGREGANTVLKPSLWSRFEQWRTKRRTALLSGVSVVALTFLINASALIYMHTHRIHEVGSGTPLNPRLYLGNCAITSKYNRYLHVGINVLSTLLLASSNMFMQLLLAPTRAEVDKAHQRQRWLDIGVFNLNNLRVVSWRSRILWFILASSSLPLHLLYNSVIYASKPMNDITIHLVTPDFITGAPASVNRSRTAWGHRRTQNMWGLEREHSRRRDFKFQDIDLMAFMNPTKDICTRDDGTHDDACTRIRDKVRETDYYQRKLSPLECLTAYSSINGNRSDVVMVSAIDSLYNVSTSDIRYQRNGSEVIVVTNPADLPKAPLNSFLFGKGIPSVMAVGFWYDYYWLCGNTNSFDCRRVKDWVKDPDIMKDWNMLGWKIDHCLAHEAPVEDKCSVSYSPHLASVVCFVNFVKLICMLYCVRILSDENPLTKPLSTIGDAINSFLLDEDATTQSLNLADRHTLAKLAKEKVGWAVFQPRAWRPTSSRWAGLVSKRRMIYSSLAWITLVTGGGAAMVGSFITLTGRSGAVDHILEIPFGDTDQYTFGQLGLDIMPEKRGSMMKGFLSIVFFANMWQFLISIAYIILNGVFTGMCVEKEWQSYAHKSKTLRVSSPIGQQRSTYFLSLPLRYAIPMMASFATLHWLMSQSIFLTVLATYNENGFFSELLYLGSSPRPLITIVSVGVILGILMICICCMVHHGALPRGGSCSAVISAACHGPPGDSDARFGPVRWGEIETVHGQVYTYDQDGKGYSHEEREVSMYGHCCFTSYEVVMPRVGRWYV